MQRLEDLLQIGDAAKLKGVSVDTLRRWEKAGKIQAVRTEGGHRRYRVADLLKIDNSKLRHTVVYGRVSTPDKKEDRFSSDRSIGALLSTTKLEVSICSQRYWLWTQLQKTWATETNRLTQLATKLSG